MASIRVKAKVKDGVAQVKCLMKHEMETGTRKDPDGNPIPAHYIETVSVEHNGQEVIQAQWGPSVSKDPYFAFEIAGAKSGDVIKVSWTDSLGESSSGESTLK